LSLPSLMLVLLSMIVKIHAAAAAGWSSIQGALQFARRST